MKTYKSKVRNNMFEVPARRFMTPHNDATHHPSMVCVSIFYPLRSIHIMSCRKLAVLYYNNVISTVRFGPNRGHGTI